MNAVLPVREAERSRISSAPGRARRWATRMGNLRPSAIREILKVAESASVISFAGGLPAPELFPTAALAEAAARILTDDGAAALQYSTTEGYAPLRHWIAQDLIDSTALAASPDRILVTHGSQQGLDLVAKVFLDPHDVVLVENPAYLGALQAFRSYEAQVVGIPSDDHGLRPDALRRALARATRLPKFLYLIPNFQNPTGVSLGGARRLEIAGIAAEYGLTVVEDDPYGRLRFTGTHTPALCSAQVLPSWVYLGTISKILAPGLRVGWAVSSDAALHEKLVIAKQAADLHTSTFCQRLATDFLQTPGSLDKQVERLSAVYGWRRDAMLAALENHLPEGCSWTHPEGGLFLWVRLPESIDTVELLRRSMQDHVAFVPGEPFWVGNPVRNTLRLNYSHSSEETIAEGIARLGKSIRSVLTP